MTGEKEALKELAALLKNELITFKCPYCDRPVLYHHIFESHETVTLINAIYIAATIDMHREYEYKGDRVDDLIILEILLQKITANPKMRLERLMKDERLMQGMKERFRKCLEVMNHG